MEFAKLLPGSYMKPEPDTVVTVKVVLGTELLFLTLKVH
jgi:hypothetical protein